jgi:hypothetical protein
MLKKVIAFLVGLSGAFAALIAIAGALHIQPRGPFWLFLCIAAGLVATRFVSNPRGHLEAASNVAQPIVKGWWALNPRLRLVILVSLVWAAAAFLIQDQDERNLKWVLIPPLALLALHFGERLMVKRKAPESELGR